MRRAPWGGEYGNAESPRGPPRLATVSREPRAAASVSRDEMVKLLLWLLLLVVCWPLAISAIVLYPLVWLLAIPFRIVGGALEGLVALVRALFFLPARLLGGRA